MCKVFFLWWVDIKANLQFYFGFIPLNWLIDPILWIFFHIKIRFLFQTFVTAGPEVGTTETVVTTIGKSLDTIQFWGNFDKSSASRTTTTTPTTKTTTKYFLRSLTHYMLAIKNWIVLRLEKITQCGSYLLLFLNKLIYFSLSVKLNWLAILYFST